MKLLCGIAILITCVTVAKVDSSIRLSGFRRLHDVPDGLTPVNKSYTCETDLACLVDSLTRGNPIYLNNLTIIQCQCPGIGRDILHPERNESSWMLLVFRSGRWQETESNGTKTAHTGTSVNAHHDITSVPPAATGTTSAAIREDPVLDVPRRDDVLLIKDMDMKKVYIYTLPYYKYVGYQEPKGRGEVLGIEYCTGDLQLKWLLQSGEVCHVQDRGWHCKRISIKGYLKFLKCDEDVEFYMSSTELKMQVGKMSPEHVSRVYKPIHMMILIKEKYLFWSQKSDSGDPVLYKLDYGNTKNKPHTTIVKTDRYVSHIKYIYPRGHHAYLCDPSPKLKILKRSTIVCYSLKDFKEPCVDIEKFEGTMYFLTTSRKLIAERYRNNYVYHEVHGPGRITRGGLQAVPYKSTRVSSRGK